MSRKDHRDNERMRKLLAGHERPAWSRERFDRLWAEAGSPAEGAPPPPLRFSPGPAVWLRRAALIAAGAVLVLGLAVLAKSQAGFDAPVASYRWSAAAGWSAAESAPPGAVREFRTAPGEELRIAGDTEFLSLEGGSRLTVRQDGFRPPFGGNPMRYLLHEGGLWLEHRTSGPTFEIETALGRISPVGTVLSLLVDARGLRLQVREGAARFAPRDGSAHRLVNTGDLLEAAPGPGEAVTVSVRTADPALPPPYRPTAPALAPVPLRLPGEAATPEPVPVPTQSAGADIPAADAAEKNPVPVLAPPTLPRQLWSGVTPPAGLRRLDLRGPWLVAAGRGSLAVLDSATGRLLAERPLAADFSGLALGERLYLQEGAAVHCIDPATGRELWSAAAGPSPFADPALDDGVLAVSSADGRLWLFDADSGNLRQTIAASSGLYGQALQYGDNWIAATSNGLVSLSSSANTPTWTYRAAKRLLGNRPLALPNGTLMAADSGGQWLALDPVNGGRLWSAEYAAPLATGPWLAGDSIIYQDAASGPRRLAGDGQVHPLGGSLGRWLAAGPQAGTWLVAGTDGLGRWNPARPDAGPERLMEAAWTMAVVDGRQVIAADSTGQLAAWSIPDATDAPRSKETP